MIPESLRAVPCDAIIELSDHEFLIVTQAGPRLSETLTDQGQKLNLQYTNRTELVERVSSRNPRSSAFIRRLMKGKTVSGNGADFIALAGETWMKGPRPMSPFEASELWEDVLRKRESVERARGGSDAAVLADIALWAAIDAAYALGCRWLPPPGHRIERLADLDLQLHLAARDVAQISRLDDKLSGLDQFLDTLRQLFPPPASFSRRWERPERGGPLTVVMHPFTFFLDFMRQEKSRLWPLFRMLRLLKPNWRIPATLFAFDLVGSLLMVPVPFIVSAVWQSTGVAEVVTALGIVALLVLLGLMVSSVKEAYDASAVSRLWLQWQMKFIHKILYRRTGHTPGEVLTRFSDAEAAFEGTIEVVTTSLTGVAYLLPAPIILMMIPGHLLAQLGLMVLVVGVIYALFSAMVYYFSAGITRLRGQTNERMVEVLSRAESIRAMRARKAAVERVRAKAEPFRDEQVKLEVVSELVNIGVQAIATLGPIALIAQAVIAVKRGEMDPGIAFGIGAWIALILGPVIDLFEIGPQIQRVLARARRFLDIYDMESEQERSGELNFGGRRFPDQPHIVRFDQVSYRHPGSAADLWTVNGKFKLAGMTAITGPSGSGKTTFLMVLNRTLLPVRGTVKIDKLPVNDISESEWDKHVVMVPTEDVLFHGTVLENLSFGIDASVDVYDAQHALEKVRLWQSLESRGGLKTMLEGPESLSHGEQKRLALARAMLRRPRVLLLDEVLDVLDPALEGEIMEMLRDYSMVNGCAIFFVVHRPGAIGPGDQHISIGAPPPAAPQDLTQADS